MVVVGFTCQACTRIFLACSGPPSLGTRVPRHQDALTNHVCTGWGHSVGYELRQA